LSTSRSSARVAATATGAIVVLVLLVALIAGNASPARHTVKPLANTGALALPPEVGFNANVTIPVALGSPQVVSWTGNELLLVSAGWPVGSPADNAGAIYQPSSGDWRTISPVPTGSPLAGVDGAWTGDRLVVGGIECGKQSGDNLDDLSCVPATLDFAAYDPKADSWTTLPGPTGAEPPDTRAGYWGKAIGAASDSRVVFQIGNQYWVLNASTNEWTHLADPPIGGDAETCLVGDRLVAMSGTSGAPVGEPIQTPEGQVGVSNYLGAELAAFDLGGGSWQTMDRLNADLSSFDYPQLLCSNDTALVFTRSLSHVWTVDPGTAAIREAPRPADDLLKQPTFDGPTPVSLPPVFRAAAWTGQQFAFWNPEVSVEVKPPESGDDGVTARRPGNAVVFDPVAQSWELASPGQGGSTVEYPNQKAWVDGYAYVPTVIDNAPTLQLYRPI
jgi:hypothetical protein